MPANLTDKTNDEIADMMADVTNITQASAVFEHRRRLTESKTGKEKGFETPTAPPPVP